MISQIYAVILMNLLSLGKRFWMSLATVVAVAIVVAVLLAFLAMSEGFQKTVEGSGSDALALIIRSGSQSEINSVINSEQVKIVANGPGVAVDEDGPIVSAELYLVVNGLKRSTQTEVNLPLRGIDKRGIELRENVDIVEGRMFEFGKNEIVVGKSALREFSGFDLGQQVKLGENTWKVVGVFSAPGSVFESELWTDARILQSQFNRGNTFQIIRAKLTNPGDVEPLKNYIDNDKRLNFDVQTEKAYFRQQSKGLSDVIFFLGWPLAFVMSIGALAGALNTMFNSVSQRTGEIATLRAIGYTGLPLFFGTLFESLLLSIVGGVLGIFVAYVFFDGLSASTLSSNFTQIVFDFRMGPDILFQGVVLALLIGIIGGVFPALRAVRVPVVSAFSA